jgi:hypothetical protein
VTRVGPASTRSLVRANRVGLIGRYMRDLTNALSGEMRSPLDEVGALRDECRSLQRCVRSAPV